jgi:hypothetical protein
LLRVSGAGADRPAAQAPDYLAWVSVWARCRDRAAQNFAALRGVFVRLSGPFAVVVLSTSRRWWSTAPQALTRRLQEKLLSKPRPARRNRRIDQSARPARGVLRR